MRRVALLILVLAVAGLVGCGPIKMPSLPKPISTPGAAVEAVRLVETGSSAARYDIDVSLYNPNDVPLPLTLAEYRLQVGGNSYQTDGLPRATLPASGRLTLTFPAVLLRDEGDGPPSTGTYQTSGTITITPAGEVRRLLYEIGWPKPKAKFTGQGEVGPATEIP